jgi:hypothetical protein
MFNAVTGYEACCLCRMLDRFRRVRKTANSNYWLVLVCRSICPHGTTRLPLDGFSWNLTFEDFFPECVQKIQIRLKFDKKRHFMWRRMEIFKISCIILPRIGIITDNSCRENQNIQFMFSNFFFSRKSCRLWGNVENYDRARLATGNVIRRMGFACWLPEDTDTEFRQILIKFQGNLSSESHEDVLEEANSRFSQFCCDRATPLSYFPHRVRLCCSRGVHRVAISKMWFPFNLAPQSGITIVFWCYSVMVTLRRLSVVLLPYAPPIFERAPPPPPFSKAPSFRPFVPI